MTNKLISLLGIVGFVLLLSLPVVSSAAVDVATTTYKVWGNYSKPKPRYAVPKVQSARGKSLEERAYLKQKKY